MRKDKKFCKVRGCFNRKWEDGYCWRHAYHLEKYGEIIPWPDERHNYDASNERSSRAKETYESMLEDRLSESEVLDLIRRVQRDGDEGARITLVRSHNMHIEYHAGCVCKTYERGDLFDELCRVGVEAASNAVARFDPEYKKKKDGTTSDLPANIRFKRFIGTVVHNKMIDHIRKKHAKTRPNLPGSTGGSCPPLESSDWGYAIEILTERQRYAFELWALGWNQARIARDMRISQPMVSKHLRCTRRKFKQWGLFTSAEWL